jgi:hypothetical protein
MQPDDCLTDSHQRGWHMISHLPLFVFCDIRASASLRRQTPPTCQLSPERTPLECPLDMRQWSMSPQHQRFAAAAACSFLWQGQASCTAPVEVNSAAAVSGAPVRAPDDVLLRLNRFEYVHNTNAVPPMRIRSVMVRHLNACTYKV